MFSQERSLTGLFGLQLFLRFVLIVLLVVSALLMMGLRILAIGWLFILGGLFVALAALIAQLVIGVLFVVRFNFDSLIDIFLFCLVLFFYVGFFIFQADFGDTADSATIVLQYFIGKNELTKFLLEDWIFFVIPMGLGLMVTYILMIVRIIQSAVKLIRSKNLK